MLNAEISVFEEKKLYGRYITNTDIEPLLNLLPSSLFDVSVIGESVLGKPIYKVRVGSGDKKILMWSQMHGNESTTTKALFDLFNLLKSKTKEADRILTQCNLCIIPILNPDGAEAYTRVNANKVDLNRDAKCMSQPESVVLRAVFDDFKPDFCFNLHGQRTIFGVGDTGKSATLSFLAPAQDELRSITETRGVAMSIIAGMNKALQQDISGGVALYDDAFNINCVGDMFQSLNVPTVLFEAGHYPDDYDREKTRFLILKSLFNSVLQISINEFSKLRKEDYFSIPENRKNFHDIIIKNVKINNDDSLTDLAFQYKEILKNDKIIFVPHLAKAEDLSSFFAHKLIDGEGRRVLSLERKGLVKENSYDYILIDNEKITLKPY